MEILDCIYDKRDSFYGKAKVNEKNGIITLYSYNTPVANYDIRSKIFTNLGKFSQTATRHQKEFEKQIKDKFEIKCYIQEDD